MTAPDFERLVEDSISAAFWRGVAGGFAIGAISASAFWCWLAW